LLQLLQLHGYFPACDPPSRLDWPEYLLRYRTSSSLPYPSARMVVSLSRVIPASPLAADRALRNSQRLLTAMKGRRMIRGVTTVLRRSLLMSRCLFLQRFVLASVLWDTHRLRYVRVSNGQFVWRRRERSLRRQAVSRPDH
ncbi:hypothetical protein PFISCL1PPCAC_20841, partial [Pristionchus fissidentatus]